MVREAVLEAENLGPFSQGARAVFRSSARFLLRCLSSGINLSLLIVFAVAAVVWKREYC